MPSGLFALLDDVATIAKVAAASIDDIGAAASKAGVKAAGVVVDDAAVTPRYVTGFQPNRELPIIWRIAKGSFFNKLVLILPALLLLSAVAQWAITPLLMIGGAYLCFEGAEKVWHSLHKDKMPLAEAAEIVADKDHEETMVKGAIRTDFILSGEIMVIALNEVINEAFAMRAATLVVVAIAITIAVYGAVGLIVKMDDIGLHMAKAGNSVRRAIGRGLVGVHAQAARRAGAGRDRRDAVGRGADHPARPRRVSYRQSGAWPARFCSCGGGQSACGGRVGMADQCGRCGGVRAGAGRGDCGGAAPGAGEEGSGGALTSSFERS